MTYFYQERLREEPSQATEGQGSEGSQDPKGHRKGGMGPAGHIPLTPKSLLPLERAQEKRARMGLAKLPEMVSEQGSYVPEPREAVFMTY